MKLNKTKNTIWNMAFGFILRIVQIIFPFAIRTIFIYTLGTEYLGLKTLFTSILNVLSLAELGVGSALVFSMYRPIAEEDVEAVCALVNLYRKCYRVIGCVIGGAGLLLIPFLPVFIKSDLPSGVNIYVLYLLNLFSTVITYFLFAYKNCLLEAHQRNDIGNKIAICINLFRYVAQGIILLVWKNYLLYLVAAPFFSIIGNCITAVIVDKKYSRYKPVGNVDKGMEAGIKKRVYALIMYKIGNIVLNSVDDIVISAFLGLTTLAIYGNYNYIMTSIFGFLAIIVSSMLAGVGNSIVTEDVEKNYRDFRKFSFMQLWIVGWCTVCLVCLYQHFIYLWVGTDFMLPFPTVIMISILFYIWKMGDIVGLYKEAQGMWYEDRFRPLIGAGINLVTNMILVQFIGINGVVLSSIICIIFVTFPVAARTLYNYYFKRNVREYYWMQIKLGLVLCLNVAITYGVCTMFGNESYASFILKCVICVILPNLLFAIMYCRSEEYRGAKEFVKNIMSRARRKTA